MPRAAPKKRAKPRAIKPKSTPRNFGLDALRALAVIGVFAAHLSIWLLETGSWSHQQIRDWAALSFSGGFFGVELFFALSGYLMGVVAFRDFAGGVNGASLKAYYMKRVMRVLPAYYAAIIILGIAAYLMQAPTPTYRHFIFFYSPTQIEPFFPIGWTLSVQMLFYLVMPFFFIPRARLALVVAGIAAFFTSRLYYAIYGAGEFEMLHRLPGIRLDGLLVGLLIAVIEVERPKLFKRMETPIFAWAMTVLLLIPVYVMADHFSRGIEIRTVWSPVLWAELFLAVPLIIALLLPGLKKHLKAPPFISKAVMVLAIYSYGFYLMHQDIFALTRRTDIIGNAAWGPWIGVPLALLGAVFIYRCVEKPFMGLHKPGK